jgi:DNA-directed RNA polymerase specialized sigma24 family protein
MLGRMPEREPTDAYAELIERLSAEQQLGSAAEQFDHLPHEQREALELRVVHDLATTRSAAVSRSRARRLAGGAAAVAVVCLTGVGIAGHL